MAAAPARTAQSRAAAAFLTRRESTGTGRRLPAPPLPHRDARRRIAPPARIPLTPTPPPTCAIESTPAEAENMKRRSALMMALREHIERQGLSQSQAAKLFGVTRPLVSDLMRGKINLFGLDSLVNMAATAGMHIEMHVLEAA